MCAVRRKVGGVVCIHVHLGLSSRPAFQLRGGVSWGMEGGGQARGQKGQVWVAGHLSR